MDKERSKELEDILFEFVKRAASKDATAAEVEALPAVAALLRKMLWNLG